MKNKRKKIIFLDINGVLVVDRNYCEWSGSLQQWSITCKESGVEKHIATFLDTFCNMYGVKLVITSTMRHNVKYCIRLLGGCGLAKYLHHDWCTPEAGSRGMEIKEWLTLHNVINDEYLIIDDHNDMLSEQCGNLILCNSERGLTASQMMLMVEWAKEGLRGMQTHRCVTPKCHEYQRQNLLRVHSGCSDDHDCDYGGK